MTTEQIPKALELADVIDGVMGSLGNEIAIELRRLAAVEAECDALRAQLADQALSLDATDLRVKNHTSLIKGCASCRNWLFSN